MRAPNQLVHSRARIAQRYAMFPLEGYPFSRLPNWPTSQVRILTAPAMGAGFVQMLIDVPAGQHGLFSATDDGVQTFYYVLSGTGEFSNNVDTHIQIRAGSFGLTPPGKTVEIRAGDALSLLIVRKKYEPVDGIGLYKGLYGHESDCAITHFADNPHSRLQLLIPDEFQFDMSMNIFTFDAGFGLPYVETHVMEHGLLFLQGKGVYLLDGTWMEVESNDFIWMGPYCPQSFYATGPTPSKYIYYKNVNRDIPL